MKIVILAAGKGKRMNDLTINTPKPLLMHQGKNLLEHKLEALPSNTTGIVFVIGYLGDQIKDYFKDSYNGLPIEYVEQKKMKGTADALWACKNILNGPFMVLMADDIYNRDDLEKLSQTQHDTWALLAYKDKPGLIAGKIIKNEQGVLTEIYEDLDGTSKHHLMYTGACVLTPDIFTRPMFQLPNGEFGLPQSFAQFTDTRDIRVIEANQWLRITSPEDLIQ